MTGVLIRRLKSHMKTETHRTPCDDRDIDWKDKDHGHHQKPRRGKARFCPEFQRENDLADTLSLEC